MPVCGAANWMRALRPASSTNWPFQAVAISSGGQATWGYWIVGGIAFVLLWSAIIIFVVFTVAAVMKLVRSMSTG
jgi:hypothetical protein